MVGVYTPFLAVWLAHRGFSALVIGDMHHKATIARAAGKTESYVDIPFYADSSAESLFVVASLQCMQTIYLYDPNRAGIDVQIDCIAMFD